MGDDAVEEGLGVETAQLESEYARAGVVVEMMDGAKEIEFCSTIFDMAGDTQPFPVRWLKMLGTLLYTQATDIVNAHERLVGFTHEMRHSPFLAISLDVIRRAGWGPQN
jgi:hypothetical protein